MELDLQQILSRKGEAVLIEDYQNETVSRVRDNPIVSSSPAIAQDFFVSNEAFRASVRLGISEGNRSLFLQRKSKFFRVY